jgi:hypothetical protein
MLTRGYPATGTGGAAPTAPQADAGVAVAVGEVLTFDIAGDAILARAGFSFDEWRVVAVALTAATVGNPVDLATAGDLAGVLFGAAPPAAQNGQPVFLSATAGQATLTPPISSGTVIYVVGVLQGADGLSVTPTVLLQPQYISRVP